MVDVALVSGVRGMDFVAEQIKCFFSIVIVCHFGEVDHSCRLLLSARNENNYFKVCRRIDDGG